MTSSAATLTPPAQRAMAAVLERCGAANSAAAAPSVLVVESIGHLVPRTAFQGRVHSVFAQACNLAAADTLLTVCAFGVGNGPTTLRLARGAPTDLRDHFEVGERIEARRGALRTPRVELALAGSRVWHPAAPGPPLSMPRIEAHLRRAQLRLDARRATRPDVLDGAAAPVLAALGAACRALDLASALCHADRLIGWGEGLTPAGDDFLVGLIGGLGALVGGNAERRRFQDALAAAVSSRAQRTTPIAAHCLRLACAGHHAEPLVELRNALLCANDRGAIESALRSALAAGATSGADTVSGLLAGLRAWLPRPIAACR
jgi:hypothetical protein